MKNTLLHLLRTLPLLAACLLFQLPAHADIVAIDTSTASGWVMENYTDSGGFVVLWYTGATCSNGVATLSLPSPSAGEISRLWAVITTAKMAGTKIFVRYDTSTCLIASFGYQ